MKVLFKVPVVPVKSSKYTVIDRCNGQRVMEYCIGTVVEVRGKFKVVKDITGTEHAVYIDDITYVIES